MSNTLTIRLPKDLADWLEEQSQAQGVPRGRLIRMELERARELTQEEVKARPFLALIGSVSGPGNLSTRRGFEGQPRPGSPSPAVQHGRKRRAK